MYSETKRTFGSRSLLSAKFLIPVLIVSIFSIASYAASVSVSSSPYQSYNGVNFTVTGGFSVVSNGFYVAPASGALTSQPCTWSNGGTCNTALTAGQWYYSVTLTLEASASPSTTYTYTVSWDTGTGYSVLGQLTFSTLATITAGQTMTFLVGTSLTSFTAPVGMTVTVA